MPQLKKTLVKPYFYIDWDDDTRFRIDAKQQDIERFTRHYKEWAKKFQDPENQDDVEVCREAFKFLCGDETGEEIFELCLNDLKDEDPDLTNADCVYQLIPILTLIGEAWIDHIASMDFERNSRVAQYLDKLKAPEDAAI